MSDIKKYLDSEIQISKFKIKVLENTKKNYSDRLIKKEKRFINFDFDVCKFSSIEEARKGVDLFRSSEREFCNLYNITTHSEPLDYNVISTFLKEKKRRYNMQ